MMNKIKDILTSISCGTPLALARFNDGEMGGIANVGFVAARGCQKVNQDLSDKLREALQYEQENYWVGIPCSVCWPKHYKLAMSLVNSEYKYLTSAVVTTNRNWKLFVEEFPKVVVGRNVVWVSGKDQNMSTLKKHTGISVNVSIEMSLKNAWKEYEDIKRKGLGTFLKGDIVVLSCGPLARVLAKEWFQERPDCTFLEIGSAFDPYTKNVRWRCHKGTLPPCEGCN